MIKDLVSKIVQSRDENGQQHCCPGERAYPDSQERPGGQGQESGRLLGYVFGGDQVNCISSNKYLLIRQ